MINYIQDSETPDGMLFIDVRVNNTLHCKNVEPDVYPMEATARHVLDVLFGEHYRNSHLTWESK